MTENELASVVVDCCIKIHKILGPGLFESVYEEVLSYELEKKGLKIVRQKIMPVHYEDIVIEMGFKADIIIEEKIILELKSVETLNKVHHKQLITYLRLSDKRLGLLINFNVNLIKDGINRIVNKLEEEPAKTILL
jgi:GxxExxY protein